MACLCGYLSLEWRGDVGGACAFGLAGDGVEEFALQGTPALATFLEASGNIARNHAPETIGGKTMVPMEIQQAFDTFIARNPGPGKPWPGAAGVAIIPGWAPTVWVGKYDYGILFCIDGEIWPAALTNDPRLPLGSAPF